MGTIPTSVHFIRKTRKTRRSSGHEKGGPARSPPFAPALSSRVPAHTQGTNRIEAGADEFLGSIAASGGTMQQATHRAAIGASRIFFAILAVILDSPPGIANKNDVRANGPKNAVVQSSRSLAQSAIGEPEKMILFF